MMDQHHVPFDVLGYELSLVLQAYDLAVMQVTDERPARDDGPPVCRDGLALLVIIDDRDQAQNRTEALR